MHAEAHNPEHTLHHIRALIDAYAQAKSDRVSLEEYRKVSKAMLMKVAEQNGVKALSAQEREAYAHIDYRQVVDGLAEATRREAAALWNLRLEEWRFEAWRTQQANLRREMERYGT